MMRFIATLLIVVMLCFGGASFGQGHASHWVFGNGFHLQFDESGPSVLSNIEDFFSFEGASCISDKEGNLLYYSNVVRIWNKNFLPLFNSDTFPSLDVPPSSSKSEGSLFLPWPGDTADRYVAFFAMNDADDKIYLSKIDRFLDAGLGGIMDSFRYQQFWAEPVAEQLNAVRHANGRDWWIIGKRGHSPDGNEFISALLTPTGMHNPTIQESVFYSSIAGNITFSKNGDLMAMTHTVGNCAASPSAVALYNFDRCEGNLEFIDTIVTRNCGQMAYGIAFSPDGSRIYYSTVDRTKLYQISLIVNQLIDTLIFELRGSNSLGIVGGTTVLGADDKIYVNYRRALPSFEFDTLSQCLGIISNPDAFGLDCQFDTLGIYLGGPFNTGYSLPNFTNYDLGPLVGSPCDTLSPQDTTQTGIPSAQIPALPFSISPTIGNGWFIMEGPQSGWAIVYDLYGREISREWHEERTAFDLTNQPAGVYLVVLRTDDGSQSLPQKIIRQ